MDVGKKNKQTRKSKTNKNHKSSAQNPTKSQLRTTTRITDYDKKNKIKITLQERKILFQFGLTFIIILFGLVFTSLLFLSFSLLCYFIYHLVVFDQSTPALYFCIFVKFYLFWRNIPQYAEFLHLV